MKMWALKFLLKYLSYVRYELSAWRVFLSSVGNVLRRTRYSTWKSYYRELQVLMIFNKKALVNISNIFNPKNPPWSLLSFASKIVAN